MQSDSTPDLFNDDDPTRRCCKCGEEKPLAEFHKDRKSKHGHTYACKACRIISGKAWFKAMNPVRVRARELKKYGLTEETYQTMLTTQHGCCAICGGNETVISSWTKRLKRLAIDHDHDTGIVRGLLCGRCNQGLGYFKHDPKLLLAAVAYLKT